MCAQSPHHAKDYAARILPAYHPQGRRVSGDYSHSPQLAHIVFHLLSTKKAYTESVFHKSEEETLRRAQYRLPRQAAQLGFQVIPIENG
jgi:hypothetical protein